MLLKTALAFFFLGLLLHGGTECSANHAVAIRLINRAHVKPSVLIEAQQEAAWVLKSLCIDVEWTVELSTKTLEMRIVSTPVGPGISNGCLGIAVFGSRRGNHGAVFLSRVLALRKPYESLISVGQLLGCVLAHELGHLLLNSRAHSVRGVMIANFGENEVYRAAQRRLIFAPLDRATLLGR
jgi:hypothetical protein